MNNIPENGIKNKKVSWNFKDKLTYLPLLTAIGSSIVALITLIIMFLQFQEMREQNRYLLQQNNASLKELAHTLNRDRESRRTYLISILYDTDEQGTLKAHKRIRREALLEFIQLDKEMKVEKYLTNPERYRLIEDKSANESDLVARRQDLDDEKWNKIIDHYPGLRTDLIDIQLQEMDLDDTDLRNIVFQGADFSGSSLRMSHLQRADFDYATLIDVKLDGANLNRATCRNTDFTGARLNGAKLCHTLLADAILDFAFLWKTSLGKPLWGETRPPKSIKLANVYGLYDCAKSGAASEFSKWAQSNGAVHISDYEEWLKKVEEERSNRLQPPNKANSGDAKSRAAD